MRNAEIETLFDAVLSGVRGALDGVQDWSLSGQRDTQYHHDVAADDAAVNILLDADVGVLSEETGMHEPDRDVIVVVDPVDGSTNASLGLPWYALSLCAVRDGKAEVARVVNLATGQAFRAVRGEGATVDGARARASKVADMSEAIIAVNGYPQHHFGWRQFRSLGASALDIAFVGAGRLDGMVDCTDGELAPWDYLGAMLVCQESGASVVDALDRPLITLDHDARRAIVAAGTPELLESILRGRQEHR